MKLNWPYLRSCVIFPGSHGLTFFFFLESNVFHNRYLATLITKLLRNAMWWETFVSPSGTLEPGCSAQGEEKMCLSTSQEG